MTCFSVCIFNNIKRGRYIIKFWIWTNGLQGKFTKRFQDFPFQKATSFPFSIIDPLLICSPHACESLRTCNRNSYIYNMVYILLLLKKTIMTTDENFSHVGFGLKMDVDYYPITSTYICNMHCEIANLWLRQYTVEFFVSLCIYSPTKIIHNLQCM